MNTCVKWKDRLLQAALADAAERDVEEHLLHCAHCAAELAALRARRKRLDTLLPLLTCAAEPSPHFRARVMAATEAVRPSPPFRLRTQLALAAVVPIILAVVIGWVLIQSTEGDALRDAENLAVWKAPSDVLLEVPGQRFRGQSPG